MTAWAFKIDLAWRLRVVNHRPYGRHFPATNADAFYLPRFFTYGGALLFVEVTANGSHLLNTVAVCARAPSSQVASFST
jgi:hypothetical protein